MEEIMPKIWKQESKPHLFCPGCGHAIALKQLGYLIDETKNAEKITFGIDIGCSLLAWDFFNIDTVQTHHGRVVPVMVGYKISKPGRIALAYMGDGAAYAIGLQSLLHAALRNNPITAIVINNENYAMTGGQMSPETMPGTITMTTPTGKSSGFGPGLRGPEVIREVADDKAYIARTTVSNPIRLRETLRKAIENQTKNNSFSFVEILAICPTNWKTDAKTSFARLKELEDYYGIGEILPKEQK